ncbi:MAG: hypothetical protein FJY29_04380 [Betaproteobacteria bacterium]|nr:hypothetical protein [Betaproteobacteria bacterium]
MNSAKKTQMEMKAGLSFVLKIVTLPSLFISLSLSSQSNAQGVLSDIKISKQQIHLLGLKPTDVRNALFLHFKSTPPALVIDVEAESGSPKLTNVNYFGTEPPSSWLRTVCTSNPKGMRLEECRGSVCKPTASQLKPSNKDSSKFVGEYGEYTLVASNLQSVLEGKQTANTNLCKASWPAWIVSARAHTKELSTAVPQHLLLVQTEKEIIWVDALKKKVWNRSPWLASRSGIFTSAEASDDGRILLKNESAALWLDFSSNSLLFLKGNTLTRSDFGLSSLFAHGEWRQGEFTIFLPATQNPALPEVNLGGLWWPNHYLSLKQAHLALQLGKSPEALFYPTDWRLASTQWSDSSGLGKARLLFRQGQQLRVLSLEDNQTKFTEVQKFDLGESPIPAETRFHASEESLATFSSEGRLSVVEGNFHRIHHDAGVAGKVLQLGGDFFVLESPKNNSCKIAHFKARTSGAGLIQGLPAQTSRCIMSLGRTSSSVSFVEHHDAGLKIHFQVD